MQSARSGRRLAAGLLDFADTKLLSSHDLHSISSPVATVAPMSRWSGAPPAARDGLYLLCRRTIKRLAAISSTNSLQIPLHHLLSGNTCFIQRGSLEHYEGRGQVYVNIQLDKEPCRRQHSESTKVVIQFQLHQFGDEVPALNRCFYSVHSMSSTCTFMYMFGFNHSEMVILSIDVEPLLV